MGKLIVNEGRSLIVSNSGDPQTDGIYLLQKTLINNRRWYIKDNTSPIIDAAIAWDSGINFWVLYLIGFPFILSISNSSSNNPWETTWDNGMVVNPITLTNNKVSIKKQNLGGGKLSGSSSCGIRNINKLVEINGISPLGDIFNNIAFDYASFASNCSALGLDPVTILNDLGGVNFSLNYVVIRAKTSNNFNADSISDLGDGIINITSIGPSSGQIANRYRFFKMCRNGWNTVRFYGTDYSI